jgi:hypothetical protein
MIIAAIIFISGLIAVIGLGLYQGIPHNLLFLILLGALVAFIVGLLILNASKKMKKPETVKNGAIWAIVLGIISLGSVSGILALIGGIIALIDSEK